MFFYNSSASSFQPHADQALQLSPERSASRHWSNTSRTSSPDKNAMHASFHDSRRSSDFHVGLDPTWENGFNSSASTFRPHAPGGHASQHSTKTSGGPLPDRNAMYASFHDSHRSTDFHVGLDSTWGNASSFPQSQQHHQSAHSDFSDRMQHGMHGAPSNQMDVWPSSTGAWPPLQRPSTVSAMSATTTTTSATTTIKTSSAPPASNRGTFRQIPLPQKRQSLWNPSEQKNGEMKQRSLSEEDHQWRLNKPQQQQNQQQNRHQKQQHQHQHQHQHHPEQQQQWRPQQEGAYQWQQQQQQQQQQFLKWQAGKAEAETETPRSFLKQHDEKPARALRAWERRRVTTMAV